MLKEEPGLLSFRGSSRFNFSDSSGRLSSNIGYYGTKVLTFGWSTELHAGVVSQAICSFLFADGVGAKLGSEGWTAEPQSTQSTHVTPQSKARLSTSPLPTDTLT